MNMQARHAFALLALVAAAGTAAATDVSLGSTALTLSPMASVAQAAPAAPARAKAPSLFGGERWHNDPEVLWPGFLTGMTGFEQFHEPVSSPIYFESALVNTSLRLIFLHHEFPQATLGGGEVNIVAAQIRLALTDRLAFIATKDGYSWFNAGILPEDSGWNDLAFGLKYALIADAANAFALTVGFRYEAANGNSSILQRGAQEWSPFISVAKGFGDLHLMGNFTVRLPESTNKGNTIVQWGLHADYDILPEVLPGFAPVIELNGVHYTSNGNRLPLSVGGQDYNNFGSSDVAGTGVVWAAAGARWRLSPHLSLGATFEYPLSGGFSDIMRNRTTVDFIFTW
jgi:hypothetical protein